MPRVEASITAVKAGTTKTGKRIFEIYTDSPAVEKLATMIEAKAREAQNLIGKGSSLIEYTISERTDEFSGRTYRNPWYEEAIGGQAPAAAPPQPAAAPFQEIQRPAGEEGITERILLGMAGKYVAGTLHLYDREQRSVDEQRAMILDWARWYKEAVPLVNEPRRQEQRQPAPAASSGDFHVPASAGPSEEPGGWFEAPGPTDDDIPF